jgi:flagellar M-ring protein FliF
VRSARVHIANPAGRPFQRTARPSASITVSMARGALDVGQAEAMRFLVASAVSGLDAQDVSVIDSAHGTVLRAGEQANGRGAPAPGSAREARLRAEIERLLAARVGEGRAIVSVAVDTTAETETTVERLIDPDSRIAISTDTREVEDQGSGGAGGAATVASNLPVGGGEQGGGGTRSRTEAEERVNYEVSETRIERVREAGEVSRITVAVLVDGIATTTPAGERVWAPRPESEIQQLSDLVRSAIGYNEERGDVVTVETLEFAPRPEETGTLVESGIGRFFDRNGMMLAQIGALTAVALGLALFVLKPLLQAAEAQAGPPQPERLPPSLDIAGDGEDDENDPLMLLRNAFMAQRDDSAGVLRSWLERDVQDSMAEEQEDA